VTVIGCNFGDDDNARGVVTVSYSQIMADTNIPQLESLGRMHMSRGTTTGNKVSPVRFDPVSSAFAVSANSPPRRRAVATYARIDASRFTLLEKEDIMGLRHLVEDGFTHDITIIPFQSAANGLHGIPDLNPLWFLAHFGMLEYTSEEGTYMVTVPTKEAVENFWQTNPFFYTYGVPTNGRIKIPHFINYPVFNAQGFDFAIQLIFRAASTNWDSAFTLNISSGIHRFFGDNTPTNEFRVVTYLIHYLDGGGVKHDGYEYFLLNETFALVINTIATPSGEYLAFVD